MNGWLQSPEPDTATDCAKQIATLCLAEVRIAADDANGGCECSRLTQCCTGDLGAAETHLQGLLMFLSQRGQFRGQINRQASPREDIREELLSRYVLLYASSAGYLGQMCVMVGI